MLDGVSLDQLRTFIAAVDEGSFSAAARRLNRVQSAVSGWVSALEEQIGVTLFDRSGRFPRLTAEGVVVTEIAPGVNLERDVLGQSEFPLIVSPQLKVTEERLFHPEPIGLDLGGGR